MAVPIARPDLVFEANFFDTSDGNSWMDLSSYIELNQGINVSRRRQLIFDEVSAGSLGLYLDNSAGTFNNDKVGNVLLGLIDIDVPVRLRARWPNVPSGTVNMLSDSESTAGDTNWFTAEMGTMDVETVTPPAGQTTAMIWYTGVLPTTGVNLLTGDVPSRSADDLLPMYVAGNTQYTAGMQVKDDAAGVGISFQVSASICWYDYTGQLISESIGTPVTLTTSYQAVSVTATSPANATTARMSLINQTIVNPAAAAFALTGIDGNQVNNGSQQARLTIPITANVGDYALAYHKSNKATTFSTPAGWTVIDAFNDGRGTTQVCGKFLTAADIGNPVFWTTATRGINWTSILCTFSGANTAATVNAHSTKSETVLGVNHVTNTVVTTAANSLIVSFCGDTSSTSYSWNTPAGETTVNQVFGHGGNATTGTVTYKVSGVVGTYGGITFTSSTKSQYCGMSTVAIKPAVGTGPGSVQVTAGAWQFVQGASLPAWAQGGHWKMMHTGLTDSWSKSFAGDLSLMYVQSTDSSKTLNAGTVGSAISETILTAIPLAYYMLDESGDTLTTRAANSSIFPQAPMAAYQVGAGGTLTWGQGVGPAVDNQAAVVVTKASRAAGLQLKTNLTTPVAESDSVTLLCTFNSSDADVSGPLSVMKLVNAGAGSTQFAYCQLWGTSGASFSAQVALTGENVSYGTTATQAFNRFDGKTHFLAGVFQLANGTLTATLYIDGFQAATNTVACPLSVFPHMDTLGLASGFPSAQLANGTYSHAAVFNYPLDSDTINDIWVAGTTAYAGETVDQRIGRIGDWSGIDFLTLDSSLTVCDRHMPATQSVLSAVQQAARTDGGTSYVADDGSATFKSRANKEATFTPWLTIDTRYIDPALSEVTDDQLLVNQVVVSRLGANTTNTTNSIPSQTIHGIYSKPIETIMANAQDAQYCGDYYIAFYSTPTQRCDQVVIDGLFPNLWATLLAYDMWNIIHITGMPAIEQLSTLDLYVEGWAISISPESWQYTFDTSSAIPFAVVNDAVRDIVGNVVVAW
jgi:hypothetical protein